MDDTEKQSIKEERVRSYFIAATKDIIMREGMESVTVRKVADLAGYSYATIYNYFSDLNALFLETKLVMVRDMVEFMSSVQGGQIKGVDEIKRLNRIYAGYYLEHPHVFHFFYSYQLTEEPKAAPQYFDYSARWRDTYQGFVANGTIREADVGLVAKNDHLRIARLVSAVLLEQRAYAGSTA